MESSSILIKSNNKTIELLLDVATTPSEISKGLMGRRYLSNEDGMIFLFPAPTSSSFWMLNTYIPLSIAFFDENGTILDIQDMKPLTIDGHSPGMPFRGALEMNKGWFAQNDVNIGDTITLPSSSHPLMLNETIYYGSDVGQAAHEGLVISSEDDVSIVPWHEVHDDLIEKIYPRQLIKKNTLRTLAKEIKVPQQSLDLEDSPGLTAFINVHGINKFTELNEKLQREFGTNYNQIVDRLTSFEQDMDDNWDSSQVDRATNWYPDEPQRVLTIGDKLGYSEDTTAAVQARLSPSTAWLDMPDFIHSGNRDESIKLLGTVRRLENSGIDVHEDVKDKKGSIIIPKGRVDLSLKPEQIAMLPDITANKRTVDSFRIKAAELAKGDLMGQPVDFVLQTAAKAIEKRRQRGVDVDHEYAAKLAMLQAPKMMSFYYTIKDPATKHFVADRHIVDLSMGGSYYGRADFKKFFTQRHNEHPVTYHLFGAAYMDAKHRSKSKRPVGPLISPFQAKLWNGHLGFNKKGQKKKQTLAFVNSSSDKLFMDNEHDPGSEGCHTPEIHDYINLQ